jgi:hypothetical protein
MKSGDGSLRSVMADEEGMSAALVVAPESVPFLLEKGSDMGRTSSGSWIARWTKIKGKDPT